MATDRDLRRVLLSARKRDRVDWSGILACAGFLAALALAFVLTWIYRV